MVCLNKRLIINYTSSHGIIKPVDRSGQPINLPDPSIFKKPENEESDHSDN